MAFDDDAPAAAAPPAAPAPALASSPPPAASAPAGERNSDPGAEVDAEDMVAEEPPAAAKAQPLPPPVKKTTAPTLTKPPLVIVPPHMGTLAPQRPETEGSGLRRKGRLWWEELFNDDFLRTSEKLTDEQIAREVDFIEDSLSIEKHGAMLDLACGTGRHAIELARRGYEVVGFDLALAMLARAGEEAQDRDTKLNFVQGDMRDMTFEEQFDGVVLLEHELRLLRGRPERAGHRPHPPLAQGRRALAPRHHQPRLPHPPVALSCLVRGRRLRLHG